MVFFQVAGDPARTTTLESVQTQERQTGGIGDPVALAQATIVELWKGKNVSPVLAETAYFVHLLKSTDEGKLLGVAGAGRNCCEPTHACSQHDQLLGRLFCNYL